jgi:hypothetical protein
MPRIIDINEVTGEVHVTELPDPPEEDTDATA